MNGNMPFQGNWLNLDLDFGMHYTALCIDLRTKTGQEYIELMRQLKGAKLHEVARATSAFIGRLRPDLRDCEVHSMTCLQWSPVIRFYVSHPSLPLNSMWGTAQDTAQLIDPCPQCKRPINPTTDNVCVRVKSGVKADGGMVNVADLEQVHEECLPKEEDTKA